MNTANSSQRLKVTAAGLLAAIVLSACSSAENPESIDPGSGGSFNYNCDTVQTSYNLGFSDPNSPAIEYCESIGEFQR